MVEDISPAEFVRRRESDARWQLVDVREPWEVETVSIAGTVFIPMAEITRRLDDLDKHCPTAVLCHSGGRSRQVAEFLLAAGYLEVANIAGGIDAWAQELDCTLARY